MGRKSKSAGWTWSILLTMLFGAVVFGCAPRESAGASAPESYELCTSYPDYGNAPCVVLSLVDGHDGYTWVSKDSAGTLAFVDMLPCASDDGPAPCVWDTERGNGRAGPQVKRYVMIRD
jgi:hypothetical protein